MKKLTKELLDDRGFTKEFFEECLEKKMLQRNIAELIGKSIGTVLRYMKIQKVKPLGITDFRKGKNNPATKKEVKEKISDTVKELWKNGRYKYRVNGMLGLIGEDNPKFSPQIKFKNLYRKYTLKFHEKKCLICNSNTRKIDIHHLDENHYNGLLTNLIPLCNICHLQYHAHIYKQPFVEISKDFKFDSAHNLLNYEGKCKNLHGHRYFLTVFCKNRINLKTNMVLDYTVLKEKVNKYIINILDHQYLNDIFDYNSTAENMLIWIWDILEKKALLKGMTKIILKETASSSAILTAEDMFFYRCENWESEIGEFICSTK